MKHLDFILLFILNVLAMNLNCDLFIFYLKFIILCFIDFLTLKFNFLVAQPFSLS